MKWISVKERLPENGQECIFCDIRGHRFIVEYDDQTYMPWFEEVTHWQPLPEPPEKEASVK
jgi:Protein of unknown function (DUF551).